MRGGGLTEMPVLNGCSGRARPESPGHPAEAGHRRFENEVIEPTRPEGARDRVGDEHPFGRPRWVKTRWVRCDSHVIQGSLFRRGRIFETTERGRKWTHEPVLTSRQ